MSALKYFHFNRPHQKHYGNKIPRHFQSKTVAVLSVSGHQIMQLAKAVLEDKTDAVQTVNLMVGVTYVSPKDNYDKAIGRAESTKKMAEVEAVVDTVEITRTHIFVRLEPIQGIKLNLRLNKRTGFATVTGHALFREFA